MSDINPPEQRTSQEELSDQELSRKARSTIEEIRKRLIDIPEFQATAPPDYFKKSPQIIEPAPHVEIQLGGYKYFVRYNGSRVDQRRNETDPESFRHIEELSLEKYNETGTDGGDLRLQSVYYESPAELPGMSNIVDESGEATLDPDNGPRNYNTSAAFEKIPTVFSELFSNTS